MNPKKEDPRIEIPWKRWRSKEGARTQKSVLGGLETAKGIEPSF